MAHNKVLIIIRGLPGSGKSTLADILSFTLSDELRLIATCEADDYFMVNGKYEFDKTKLPDAHRMCYNKCKDAMEQEFGIVIVSNTSCSRGEYTRYIDLARQYDYAVQVIDVHGEFESVHNLPQEAMDKMEERWEAFDRSLLA